MKLNRIIAAGFLGLALFAASTADACTNFLFTKGATKDGSTMITYAADSHTLYGELYYRKAAAYPAGTMFQVVDWDSGKPLIMIPQVAQTYSVVGNMNEHQLAIGETTYGGREELATEIEGGIDYGSYIYLTLQRAKNAREAIQVLAGFMSQYPYHSEGESFSICDPNEVWILELIGKRPGTVKPELAKKLKYKYTDGAVWVARRIPDGYVSGHANQARITQFPQEGKKFQKAKGKGLHKVISSAHLDYLFEPEVECVYSSEVITYARACGWYDGADADFSFADTYAPLTFSGLRGCDARVYAMFNRVAKDMQRYEKYAMGDAKAERLPLWIEPDHKISVHEAMQLMRDHYEGTSMDMSKDLGAGPFNCPYRWRPMGFELDGHSYIHERATSTQQTGFSFVAQCRSWRARVLPPGQRRHADLQRDLGLLALQPRHQLRLQPLQRHDCRRAESAEQARGRLYPRRGEIRQPRQRVRRRSPHPAAQRLQQPRRRAHDERVEHPRQVPPRQVHGRQHQERERRQV